MRWAQPVISDLKIPAETQNETQDNKPGAQRLLNGVFLETLLTVDEGKLIVVHSIDDAPSPASPAEIQAYTESIQVFSIYEGKTSKVEWRSQWQAENDNAVNFFAEIYKALLQSLQRHFSN